MIDLREPASKPEILRELAAVHVASTAFWDSIPSERFFAPQGEAWSPCDHVRHLDTSIRAVARGLGMPRLVLFGRFGVSLRPARSFAEVRDLYRAVLAGGGKASGRYVPTPQEESQKSPAARHALMERRESTAASLEAAIEGWGERALDRLVLPHPLIGRMTVREMLFFTLYHNAHHVETVARREASLR